MEKEKNQELKEETLENVTGGIWLGNQIQPVPKINGQSNASTEENAAGKTADAFTTGMP